jgi:hypothetical protein
MKTTLASVFAAAALASACSPPTAPAGGAAQQGPVPASAEASGTPTTTPTSAPTSAPAAETGHTRRGPTMADPLDPGASGHFGAPFTVSADPIPLERALTECADTGSACLVSGTIERVCQSRGCWFTFAATDAPTVRVRMLDYGFLVPRNVAGAQAVIEGTLARTVVPQAVAQHYADDEAAAGSGPAQVVEGDQDAFEFTITGAQITRM